ncbi:response regulator transcription factor [Candidatus Bipolaricaulota bacterium]|nr:response regulator transcription factor [Candidatus Bipolaricaulota bacterium]MBS3793210.1 response regulator transcription factor [Candidatus Bipolaricaulota bacterium]
MNEKVVLIVGEQGEFMHGIKALVEAIPEVQRVVHFEAFSGQLDRITKIKPNLVILDSPQSREDYRNLLRQLQRTLPLTRIITLVEEKCLEQKFQESGADGVLVKGFRGDLFIRTVRSLIRSDGGRDSGITGVNDTKEG